MSKMNKDDTVIIWGDGHGTVSGKNAFGGTINASSVTETYLSDQTSGYSDDSDPSPS